jgi:hypothetical protein
VLLSDRTKQGPTGLCEKGCELGAYAFDVESTGHDREDLGVGLPQRLPIEPGGVFAALAEQIAAAGEFDEFRDPVPRSHQRIDPLLEGLFEVAQAGRTDFALILGQDQGRSEFAQTILVDAIHGQPFADEFENPVVDLETGTSGIELCCPQHR